MPFTTLLVTSASSMTSVFTWVWASELGGGWVDVKWFVVWVLTPKKWWGSGETLSLSIIICGWMDGWYYPKICHSISSASIANAIWNPAPCGLSNAVAAGVPQLQQRAWRSIRSLANWEKMNSVSPVLDELWNYDLQRNEFPDPFQSSLHMTSGIHVWGPESGEPSYNLWMQWSSGADVWDHSNSASCRFYCIKEITPRGL